VWNVFITTICSVSWVHDSNISPVTLAQLPSLHLHSFRRDSINDDPSGNPTDVFPYVDACYSLWSSRTINMIDIFSRSIDSSCAFIQFRLPHAVIAILDDRHSFANFTRSHTHFDHKRDRKSFSTLVNSFNGRGKINRPQNYHYSKNTRH